MNTMDLGIVATAHTTSPMPTREYNNAIVKKAPEHETFLQRRERIRHELIKAGATRYGLSKFNARYLPSIIREGEHIHGVVYGRHNEGGGFLDWVDRMIVATDHRVISFNHKPGYTDDDEFTYDVVNGVDSSTAGPFTAITLDTRLGKVTLRFVRKRCAAIFTDYVERRRVGFFKSRTSREIAPKDTF